MNSNETENLTGAYVLDAATTEEREKLEAAADRSQSLRNEMTELNDTAVLLGLAVEPVQPSAELKSSIMAMLDSTPQLAAEPESHMGRLAAAQNVQPAKVVSASQFDRPAQSGSAAAKAQTRWFARPVAILTAAAAAVALVAGGVVVTNQFLAPTHEQAQVEELAAISAAEDSQRVTSDVAGGGTATLVWSEELGSAALMVDGIATLPSGKTYQLWYIDGNGARPAGTFEVEDGGSTWRVLDGAMGAGDTVGVTVEPEGGSKTPTTAPVVAIRSA